MQPQAPGLRDGSARRLANLKPFQKGVSGNPGGVPKSKTKKEIRQLAREHSEDAFKRIVKLMGSDDERVAFMAAKEVLDRAWGKPKDDPDAAGKGTVTVNIVRFADGAGSQPPKQLEAKTISATAVDVP